MWPRVQALDIGLGFGVQGLGFRVLDLDIGFRVWGNSL